MAEQERRILAEQAQIQTARVEIKTLTVGGKQMTLAVFRQLPEREVIDWRTLELRGIGWGWVNYHLPECKDTEEHLHVVWQEGAELRRSTVEARGWMLLADQIGGRCRAMEEVIACGLAMEHEPTVKRGHEEWVPLPLRADDYPERLRFDLGGGNTCTLDVSCRTANRLSRIVGSESFAQRRRQLAEMIAELTAQLRLSQAEAQGIAIPERAWEWREQQFKRRDALPAAWAAMYQGLVDLGQLFIAV